MNEDGSMGVFNTGQDDRARYECFISGLPYMTSAVGGGRQKGRGCVNPVCDKRGDFADVMEAPLYSLPEEHL